MADGRWNAMPVKLGARKDLKTGIRDGKTNRGAGHKSFFRLQLNRTHHVFWSIQMKKVVSEDEKKILLDGLKAAIKAEVEGQYFYNMAAVSTEDKKGKQVFRQLAEEEKYHEDILMKQYNSLIDTDSFDTDVQLNEPQKFEKASPIFSKKIKKRIKDAHYEMTALSIGVQLELSSIDFYRKQAALARMDEVKKFYSDLATWETEHYNALLKQQEELKEEYWANARFAPF